jgi:hypothetical protein
VRVAAFKVTNDLSRPTLSFQSKQKSVPAVVMVAFGRMAESLQQHPPRPHTEFAEIVSVEVPFDDAQQLRM